MKLRMVGCNHRSALIEQRGPLSFNRSEASHALSVWRQRFPHAEAVLLSTCNRVELYTAAPSAARVPETLAAAEFLAECRDVSPTIVSEIVRGIEDSHVVRHLFTVTSSLDSMVVGETQIVSQVKQAYELAEQHGTTGPVTHGIFQAALRTARRVASETKLHQRRVSIPSVAIADFAAGIFDRFDNKHVLVVGAGEMAEETLHHLAARGVREITVVNRSRKRAEELAQRWSAQTADWSELYPLLARADVVVSATSAHEPVIRTREFHERVTPKRQQRTLFVLDLAVPNDIEAEIGDELGVYLYSIDDLAAACQKNLSKRHRELPAVEGIIREEADRFMTDAYHRLSTPTINRLRRRWEEPKQAELIRLLNKLGPLEPDKQEEIRRAFDRLINKLLHTPLESLRGEARQGTPDGLLEALKRLFRLED